MVGLKHKMREDENAAKKLCPVIHLQDRYAANVIKIFAEDLQQNKLTLNLYGVLRTDSRGREMKLKKSSFSW